MTTFIKTKINITDDQTNIDKYRLAANITEYDIISKLILLRIIIAKFMMTRQLFHVKNVCKTIKNQQSYNGRTDALVLIIELLCFLQGTKLPKE